MKKTYLIPIILLTLMLTACGNDDTSANGDSGSKTNVESSQLTDSTESDSDEQQTASIEPVHEHEIKYTSNEDGTHTFRCNGCDEIDEQESCTLSEDGKCELCGYVHEHSLEYTVNTDDTHTAACSFDWCDYEVAENCDYDNSTDTMICSICEGIHSHHYVKDKRGEQVYLLCSLDGCDYEEYGWREIPFIVYINNVPKDISGNKYYLIYDMEVTDILTPGIRTVYEVLPRGSQVTIYGNAYDTVNKVSGYVLEDGRYLMEVEKHYYVPISVVEPGQVALFKGTNTYCYDYTNLVGGYASVNDAMVAAIGFTMDQIKAMLPYVTDSLGQMRYEKGPSDWVYPKTNGWINIMWAGEHYSIYAPE